MRITEFFITWRDLILNFISEIKRMFSAKSMKELVSNMMSSVSDNIIMFRERLSNLRQTNIDLAMHHYNSGNLKDAVFRFKMIKRFYKDYPYSDYYLGRCYLEMNNTAKAKTHLSSYIASNDAVFREGAEYCYRIVTNDEQSIKNVPDIIAERIQDQIARVYDAVFFKSEDNYSNVILANLNKYFGDINSPYGNKALDMCTSTGKVSEVIKQHKISNSIDGIAISEKMLDLSSNLKIEGIPVFNGVTKMKISELLSSKPAENAYKLIIADSLMNFTSDINSLVAYISSALDEKGVGVIVFRNTKKEGDFFFDYMYEEFTYDVAYVEKCIQSIGMKVHTNQSFTFPNGDVFSIMLLIK